VPATGRETADAAPNKQEASLGEFAATLPLDKSVTSRRARDATDRRYLANLKTPRGRPARIVLGDPMREMMSCCQSRPNWLPD
jgi:hypothetical protein